MTRTRRSVLRAGCGVLAGGLLAGCTGNSPSGESGSDTGSGTTPKGPASSTNTVVRTDTPPTTQPSAKSTTTRPPTAPSSPETTVGDARYVGDFTLWNDDNETHTISVSVGKKDTELLRETYKIKADSAKSIPNPIKKQGTYQIQAEIRSGAKNAFEWEISSCNNYEYIQIYINKNSKIEFKNLKQTVFETPTCSDQTTNSE